MKRIAIDQSLPNALRREEVSCIVGVGFNEINSLNELNEFPRADEPTGPSILTDWSPFTNYPFKLIHPRYRLKQLYPIDQSRLATLITALSPSLFDHLRILVDSRRWQYPHVAVMIGVRLNFNGNPSRTGRVRPSSGMCT